MKKIFIVLVLLLLVVGYYSLSSEETSGEVRQEYTNGEFGFSFEYRASPDGYLLQEPTFNPDFNEGLLKVVTLINEEEYNSIIRGERDGGEGPPVIDIFVFDNSRDLTLAEWIEVYPQYSNITLILEALEETTFAGTPALSYTADGLYASRNIVFSHRGNIFLITGQFMDRGEGIYRDFDTVLSTFELEA
ncbi:MAG: hypothetical protein WDZ64_00895 [Parcubacteria group bacterium]